MPIPARPYSAELDRLARLYGVITAFTDVTGRRRRASTETLLAVLRALGAPILRPEDAAEARRVRQIQEWRRRLPPVVVAWTGRPAAVPVRLPAHGQPSQAETAIRLESGERRAWTIRWGQLTPREGASIDGRPFSLFDLDLPHDLPPGYHRFTLEQRGRREKTLIVSAPPRAWLTPRPRQRQRWGLFLPLYALRTAGDWGVGDYVGLAELAEWIGARGGSFVSTLPFLAAFLEEPFDPSPYAPVSRLFWNEGFVDVTQAEELACCPTARDLIASSEFRGEIARLKAEEWVDYRSVMRLKRQALELLAEAFFAAGGPDRPAFRRFLAEHPDADRYARFRAAGQRQRRPWPEWPARARDGRLGGDDFEETSRRYHLYVQWLADGQVRAAAERARRHGPGLYLDLPLGSHPDGFDTWRHAEAHALGVSAGAPPDGFFVEGQRWGFPPLHPEGLRRTGHQLLIKILRHQMRRAGLLRIDHVMWLHRLYWIPEGLKATEGAYVRYPTEELYALLTLESHRAGTVLVGEDLGTVPPGVRSTLRRRGLHRLYILPFELPTRRGRRLRPPPRASVAGLNTHDVPPFAGLWQGEDIAWSLAQGRIDAAEANRQREGRAAFRRALVDFLRQETILNPGARPEALSPAEVLEACLRYLRDSPARFVLINLEDLWLETRSQNIPGTEEEFPNWRRKARLDWDALRSDADLDALLRRLNRLR